LWIALALLMVNLTISAFAALDIKADVEAAAQREFDFICNEVQTNIAKRLAASAQLLHSGAGLFDASQTVSREQWRAFTNRLQIEQQLPGIQGVGFARLIPPAQLDQHIQEIRDEGFPDYTVRPGGERDIYSSIVYLEPFSDRNLRAFGYDMFSEAVRRAAMEQARDENRAILSGKVVLVQETSQDVQAGALMYVPVYRHGMPTDTVDQRRAAILGWVYSPYRMGDMINGTLRGWGEKEQERQITLQVYDGDLLSSDTLLYDSQGKGDDAPGTPAALTKLVPVDFAGHRWTLRFTRLGGLASAAEYRSFWLVLSGGTIISLLLFWLMISLLRTRVNAQRIADQLTRKLWESEEKYRTVADFTYDWETWRAPDNTYLYVSPSCARVSGHTAAEFLADPDLLIQITHPDDRPVVSGHYQSAADEAEDRNLEMEFRILLANGETRWISHLCTPVYAENGQWLGRRESNRDITARKQAEAALHASETRYRALFENSDDGILLTVPDGRILSANPAACQMFGRSEAEICAGGRAALLDAHNPHLAAALEERARSGRVRTELTFLRRDGSRFPGEITSVLFSNENDETQSSMTIRDISERVRLQEELRISLEKYRLLFETFPLGIIVTDPTGVILESNRAAEKLLGMPREVYTRRTIDSPEWHAIRRDGTPMPAAEYAGVRALQEQQLIEDVEMGVVTSPDAITWLSITAAPFPLPGYGVVIAYYDIGKRIHSEEALRESETTLRVLIDATQDSVLLLESDGTIVIGNETVAARLNQPVTSMPGRHMYELLPPAAAEFRQQQMQTVLRTGQPIRFEDERAGRWIDNSVYPVYNTQGKVTRIAIFGRDITERKLAEMALRESEERFRRFLQEVQSVSVQGYGPDGTTQYWNHASELLYGYSAEEAIGRNLLDLIIPPEMRDDVAQAIRQMSQTGEPIPSAELTLMHKNGSRLTVFSSHAIIQTPGRAQELFCVDIDISERKLAEAALAEAKHAAEAGNRAKGEFLANMSHELRTPLNAILGFSDLLLQDDSLSPHQKENLSIINRSGGYLLGLINDVLDMAKIEAGRVTLQECDFDLRRMIGDLMALFQIRAVEKGLTLSATLDPGVPVWVHADENKLRQVILNLVGNAVKFTPTGSVDLAVRPMETADGPHLLFAVRDTGPGIAGEEQGRIFEPFVQTASGHTAQEGTGLGLSISHRFVQLMGGTLTVTSSGVPGEGSVFQFHIPLVPVGADCVADHPGWYMAHPQDISVGNLAAVADPEPRPAFDLTGLPSRWIKQVQQAAAEADALRLSQLAAEVSGEQPNLAVALQKWIDEYNYIAIQSAVKIS